MSKVSVIIPVFNREAYLKECLNSLIRQTLSDIEIIVVDDGSEDCSPEIELEYAKSDARIKVIRLEHQGVSAARNAGINHSSSPYLMFVDSDDYVSEQFCEIPYLYAEKSGADIVCFRFSDLRGIEKSGPLGINHMISREEALVLLSGWNISDSVCNKLFKRDLFDDIQFPVGSFYEDIGTVYRLLMKSACVYASDDVLYTYRDTPGSTSKNNSEKIRNDLKAMQNAKFSALLEVFSTGAPVFHHPDVLRYALEYVITREAHESEVCDRLSETVIQQLSDLTSSLPADKKRLHWLYLHMKPVFDQVCRLKGYRS